MFVLFCSEPSTGSPSPCTESQPSLERSSSTSQVELCTHNPPGTHLHLGETAGMWATGPTNHIFQKLLSHSHYHLHTRDALDNFLTAQLLASWQQTAKPKLKTAHSGSQLLGGRCWRKTARRLFFRLESAQTEYKSRTGVLKKCPAERKRKKKKWIIIKKKQRWGTRTQNDEARSDSRNAVGRSN